MMSRRSRGNTRHAFEIPTLPFMSIMLGLMSVMVLTTIGISIEQRQEIQKGKTVELVGVPSGFIPFHVRCQQDAVTWLDDKGVWHELSTRELGIMLQAGEAVELPSIGATELLGHLLKKVNANRALSFDRRQNSLILWVEPAGVHASIILQYLIATLDLPLRVGLLPILENEKLLHDKS